MIDQTPKNRFVNTNRSLDGQPQNALEKFQALLYELFEFDGADLDFGIYRIMNYKRAAIRRFIAEDLPKAIAEELQRGALAEQGQAQKALKEARQRVLSTLGKEALDAEGNLVETYRETPVGREYLEAQERAKGARSTEALETTVYNHLYTFFSRYWQDGDFISKRRYSKKERYAIPYNGEEVYLYWANHDQYYIKTGEYFTDYTYQAPNGVTVHFKLQQANVEQNNVKGEKRFFLPVLEGITWDEKARTLTIPFHFRPLTEQDTITYGQKNQQEAIIAEAVTDIPERVKATEALTALTAERRKTEKGESVSWLEHHLRQYTRRNTSDFFIHKDLRGFLSRELDFYLKNEVLNLDEMEAAGEQLAEGWFQLMRLIKRVGRRIIEFLAQIEDFQKMLWEKKKFITETFYVITVGNIPEAFHEEITDCEAQWEEWKALLHIDEGAADLFTAGASQSEKRLAFLKAHPTLPLDTRHFPPDFTDRLLASFDRLDEVTDGLLIHSENWQALNLLQEKYRERVKCIYIDPPYNTAASEILYKNDYKHSSWLSMMENRLGAGGNLLLPDGSLVIAIDDTEKTVLSGLLRLLFPSRDENTVIVNHHPAGAGLEGANISATHEYAIFVTPAREKVLYGPPSSNSESRIGFMRTGTAESNLRRGRPNSFYAVLVDPTTSKIVGAEPPPQGQDYPRGKTAEGFLRIYPVSEDGTERVWRRSYESFFRELQLGNLECVNNKTLYIRSNASEKHKPIFSNWTDTRYNAGAYGTNVLTNIIGMPLFSYPKSLYTVLDCISAVTIRWKDSVILDFFAGSGTTGHAVINLNREDGGRRKFILVEMAHYFDTVLLPRLKKVTFAPEWKDGKPKRMATAEEAERSPRLIKVIRLESYEDTLNNLTFDDTSGQKAMELFGEDYLLHYMLRWETRHSETLLDVEKLQTPFSYKLRLHRDGETRERAVDLPETFNYLLGLDVQTRKALDDNGRRYLIYRGTLRNGRTVAVIWRETQGWTKEDYKHDRKFVDENKLTDGADEVFLNGDSLIPGAQSLDGLFKERMFASVEG